MATVQILLRQLIFALLLVLGLSNEPGVSKEEYIKMKKYLRFMNRPHVKTIKTEYGETFDCVDIYKQPAMDNPLLKNHTIKMRPSFFPERIDIAPEAPKTNARFGLPDGGCPPLTVPIKRVPMEDLLRAGSVSNFVSKGPAPNDPLRRYAMERVRRGHFLGTEVLLSIWQPKVADESQFSLAQFWVTNGVDAQRKGIEAGWQVNPKIYKDQLVHLFTYWTADGYKTTGCYNVCEGFVQVNNEFVPGMVLKKFSEVDKEQIQIDLSARKDEKTGDWWLISDNRQIGYWPNKVLGGLDYAERITWGGEIYSSTSDNFPQMGSGEFAEQGFKKAAYLKSIKVINENGEKVDAPAATTIRQTKGCCTVVDGVGDWGGRYFFYGGPGGKCDKTSSAPLVQVV